jgi:hypothetical protein
MSSNFTIPLEGVHVTQVNSAPGDFDRTYQNGPGADGIIVTAEVRC